METHLPIQEIACQQVLLADSSVFSIQRTILPASVTGFFSAVDLQKCYLAYIRSCTLTIIRPMVFQTGIEFRLFGTNWSLITFLPPVVEADSVTLRICGGLFVQSDKSNCGKFRFGVEPVCDGLLVSLQLSGYFPMILGCSPPSCIRFRLYRLTQSAIHRLVTLRFLTLLYKELAGSPAAVRAINISISDGRPL